MEENLQNLGEDPGGYFNCDIRLVDGRMIIDFEGEEKVNMDVSFWTFPSYWKAGAYLQDNGEATIHFDDLFIEDGTQQNFFPSVDITSPTSGTNFLPGSDITITADAADSDGTVTKVDFFANGNIKLGEITAPPYSLTWTNVEEGDYVITAIAYDNDGGSRTSLGRAISVRVQVDVTSITLNELSGPIAVGASIPLETLISPSNATNQNMVFESGDTNIGTVDENGLFTAVTEGEVTITVTTTDGEFVDSKVIQVLTPFSEFNWALGQPVTGTGVADGPNVAANIVDDNTGTRWSVNGCRFVRITVSSADVYTGPWVSITELRVFGEGERVSTSVNEFVFDKVILSPNPATSIINIENGEDFEFVTIYDQSGRIVLQRKLNNSGTIDVRTLQSGMFVIKLEGKDTPRVTKFIKQ